jgi:hypothetical protein
MESHDNQTGGNLLPFNYPLDRTVIYSEQIIDDPVDPSDDKSLAEVIDINNYRRQLRYRALGRFTESLVENIKDLYRQKIW